MTTALQLSFGARRATPARARVFGGRTSAGKSDASYTWRISTLSAPVERGALEPFHGFFPWTSPATARSRR